jgi:hypothetical protein
MELLLMMCLYDRDFENLTVTGKNLYLKNSFATNQVVPKPVNMTVFTAEFPQTGLLSPPQVIVQVDGEIRPEP